MTIGDMVRDARCARDLSQRQLGKLIGVSGAAVCYIETGDALPSARLCVLLERELKIELVEAVADEVRARFVKQVRRLASAPVRPRVRRDQNAAQSRPPISQPMRATPLRTRTPQTQRTK